MKSNRQVRRLLSGVRGALYRQPYKVTNTRQHRFPLYCLEFDRQIKPSRRQARAKSIKGVVKHV
ncbi:hypothetical protein [Serratia sp. JSRIV006]|uniref:hypothetical protein n=1 Tax=Serratia sp. JSRIV006 TaxID=2831896 RepID=UPI001CC10150|nr:hypothetical protein [Serratia sp. JSRIV006]UAN65896.1 hypothetical protein KGP16_27365 [Serratia sp. JSRIV006]